MIGNLSGFIVAHEYDSGKKSRNGIVGKERHNSCIDTHSSTP